MTEQYWTQYLALLAQAESTLPAACVGCWYEQHEGGQAFPGDQMSSTLCPRHRQVLPAVVKEPDSLMTRRCA